MGLFGFGKPKQDGDRLLIDVIEHNADRIVQSEGKPRSEGIYLAVCLVYDDLSKRPNGQAGRQALMRILQSRYPEQINDVVTYVAWSSGQIALKPEFEAELIARHK